MVTTEGKHCTKCGLFKALDSFYPKRADCKKCRNRQIVARRRTRLAEDPVAKSEMLRLNKLRLRQDRKDNRDRFRSYWRKYLSDPDNLLRHAHRRRAHKMGVTRELIEEVWVRDGSRCVWCDSVESLHLDHVMPVSRGYNATLTSDFQVLCQSCNLFKSDRIVLEDGLTMLKR